MEKKKTSGAVKRDRFLIFLFPVVVAIIAYLIIYRVCIKENFVVDVNEGIDDFKTMLGIWGTLLGFLITAISILLTLGNGKFLGMLKDTGHYKTILLSYISSCVHLLTAILISIVFVFMRMWSVRVFAVMCALVFDTMITVLFCLFFLFVLVVRGNE